MVLIEGVVETVTVEEMRTLILDEFANFVVKNLFNRNKQIKNLPFLNQIDHSLLLIEKQNNNHLDLKSKQQINKMA